MLHKNFKLIGKQKWTIKWLRGKHTTTKKMKISFQFVQKKEVENGMKKISIMIQEDNGKIVTIFYTYVQYVWTIDLTTKVVKY